MLELNEKTKKNIQKVTGLTVSEISEYSVERVDSLIEEKLGEKLKVTVPRNEYLRKSSRGSIFIWLSRLINLDDIDRKLLKR